MNKLTTLQAEALVLVDDNTKVGGKYMGPLAYRPGLWSPTLGRKTCPTAATIRSLERRRLVEIDPARDLNCILACRITEDGRLQIERWQDDDAWPISVAKL